MSEDLSPELRALLDAERQAAGPAEETRNRVFGKVQGTLGLVGAGVLLAPKAAQAASALAKGATPKLLGLGAGKLAGLVLATTLVSTGGYLLLQHKSSAPAARVTAPVAMMPAARTAPSVQVVPAVSPTFEPDVLERQNKRPQVRSTGKRDKAAAAGRDNDFDVVFTGSVEKPDDLAEERTMLEEARTQLLKGDHKHALEVLTRHHLRHPTGQLSEERDGLTVRALSAAGRRADAEELAEEFRHRYPQSIFRRVVEDSLRQMK